MQFVQIPKESFATAIADSGAPQEITGLLNYLFDTVLDGRNAYLSDGVQRALGRAPTDFADYTHRTAASGVWDLSAQTRFAPLVAAIALSGRPRTASASTPMRAGVRRAESGSSGERCIRCAFASVPAAGRICSPDSATSSVRAGFLGTPL